MESDFITALARFAADVNVDTLPEPVVEKAKICIVDAIANAFAGHQTGISKMFEDAMPLGDSDSQQATAWVEGTKTGYLSAALHNCLLVHTMIHDDQLESCRGHLGNLVVPTVLAMSEVFGASGKDILAAIVAGYEVVGRIATPAVAYSVDRGFRGTSTYGPFAVAAAAGRLFGFNSEQMSHAISCAASFSSGLLEPFDNGSMEWRQQSMMSLIGGIMAANTTKAGFKSSLTALESDSGWLKAFCGSSAITEVRRAWQESLSTLGQDFEVSKIYFKPYATCGYNQIACDITVKLVEEHNIRADQVDQINIKVSPDNKSYPGIDFDGPFDSLDGALLSKPFTVGAAVVYGGLQVETYAEGMKDSEVERIAKSIRMEGVETYSALDTEIQIVTKGGETYTGDVGKADLSLFFPDIDGIKSKLDMMAGRFISTDKQNRIMAEVIELESKADASGLVRLLVADR